MSDSLPAIQEHTDLTPYNTLHVTAKAKKFVSVQSEQQLQSLLKNYDGTLPLFVLGGGSNVLFINDFNGLILHIAILGKEVIKEDENYIWLKVGAGENWHETVRYCVEKGWGGIENLSLIPGTVGAAPIQNIGAYGVELDEVFESLAAVELKSVSSRIFYKKDCEFAYRDSVFKQELKGQFAVTSVTLKLSKYPVLNTSYGAIQQKLDEKEITAPSIRDISDIVIEIRNSKLPDPAELGNAGSFFKNPVIGNEKFESLKSEYPSAPGYPMDDNQTKVPAGWLIEQAGWKGKVTGSVGTYRQQALVIVNHGGASGEEIWQLAEKIQQSVDEMFDIKLVPEVNIVG
ncbi:MAG: UDP-N-acetylmuramate dehydrogenase [Balneolaceae bacterium]|nr:UDP-N-acetylmuramate dehydrogenase [Balneolaceae bacterium]